MLNGLQEEFDYVITSLHALGEQSLFVNLLESRLFQEERKSILEKIPSSTNFCNTPYKWQEQQ